MMIHNQYKTTYRVLISFKDVHLRNTEYLCHINLENGWIIGWMHVNI